MNVLAFPATTLARSLAERAVPATVRELPDRTAVDDAQRPLHEMLRKAVVAYRAGEDRAPSSLGHRHHLAIAHAYLDAAAILTGVPGAAAELAQCLDVAIFDIRKLARIASAASRDLRKSELCRAAGVGCRTRNHPAPLRQVVEPAN